MNELNQNFEANIRVFLMGFKDEVVKGLQNYLKQYE